MLPSALRNHSSFEWVNVIVGLNMAPGVFWLGEAAFVYWIDGDPGDVSKRLLSLRYNSTAIL